ncbi:phosphoethanolamine transferase domain-containing protein [Pseudoalteromonas denitrificans]|uniref:phosphoethanolamine transferase domain-containing protein n=1 Tax=Pseudoalteromonas denitrificans TaxID=43656 RepID=UPI000B82360C
MISLITQTINSNILTSSISTNKPIILTTLYYTVVLNLFFLSSSGHPFVSTEQYKVIFLCSVPLFLSFLILFIFTLFLFDETFKPHLISKYLILSLLFYIGINDSLISNYVTIENTFPPSSASTLSYFNKELTTYFICIGLLPSLIFSYIKIHHQPIIKEVRQRYRFIITAMFGFILVVQTWGLLL